MHIATRCILLVIGLSALGAGRAQTVKADTFVLHFAFDRSGIRPADTAALRLFAREQQLPDSITITGYTDTVGTSEYNQRLSLQRAITAATAFLRWFGTDSSRSPRVIGYGEADALPGNDSGSRRVLIVCFHHPSPPQPVVVKADTLRDKSEPDTVFELEDIRFYANTVTLTDAARFVLPRHINYLISQKGKYLEVDGYCNSPGPPLPLTDPLYILSVQRAKFIYDCLIEKGFDSTQLAYKGKGNANPRNAHPVTRDEADKNMRVEIRVFRSKPPEP
jgi:outer membrane protein OmpA-like peptidoglycan-associated protein